MAVVLVGFTMAAGAWGLVHLIGSSLEESIENGARLQAASVAQLIEQGALPDPLPRPTGPDVVQVVSPVGKVVSASEGLAATSPLVTMAVAKPTLLNLQIPRLAHGDEDPFLTLLVPVTARKTSSSGLLVAGERYQVAVVASLSTVERTTDIAAIALAGGIPVLLILVGALAWILTGLALRPVEELRAEVADVSARDLHRRVQVPGSGDEIARLAKTMNAMLGRLEDGAERQKRLVGDASHELRTPLASIRANLEFVIAHPDDPGTAQACGEAHNEATRMQRIVDDLLVLARADSGTLALRPGEVDVDEIVIDEARRLRAHGRVNVDTTGLGAGRVTGDRDLIRRAVRNLADNAERFAYSTVWLGVRCTQAWVAVTVADDGPGIPESDRSRVLERFARLDEHRSGSGAGLGLAIAREIVQAHGGSLEVDSRSGGGAKLVIRLPYSEQDPGSPGTGKEISKRRHRANSTYAPGPQPGIHGGSRQ
ncbi:MAG: HAMP domain-containing histidine kinase [Actinobacteria bacterium]|nr:HAMP domain-containing histidine kinase [Actinomycetota bacterium]